MILLRTVFRARTREIFCGRGRVCDRYRGSIFWRLGLDAGSRWSPVREGHNTSRDLSNIRNVAIIAHVDHGKTTLVDKLLIQGGALADAGETRVMDSIALERERGITIMSKATSVEYGDYLINIVDTPGHADFGGEVERVLSMVDGVCLLVCATEGPMPQTRYVLQKALKNDLKTVVVINKVDRDTSRIEAVENELLDLFINFNSTEDQLDYGPIYASSRDGWAATSMSGEKKDMKPLFDAIVDKIPPPTCNASRPFSMLVTQTEDNQYFGRACLGLIKSGSTAVNGAVKLISASGGSVKNYNISKITRKRGTDSVDLGVCCAGEIVYVYGVNSARINDTICAPEIEQALPYPTIDPPTLSVMIYPNDSPLAGRDGKYLTIYAIGERLMKEAANNVSITVTPLEDAFELKARGEIQIGILLETMRREGYEMSVSSPRVIYKTDTGKGKMLIEPIEEVTVELDTEISGIVIGKLESRRGTLVSYKENGDKTKLVYLVPTRGLLGLQPELRAESHNTVTIVHTFHSYEPHRGPLDIQKKGLIVSTHSGTVTSFALQNLENRGTVFVKHGDDIYAGTVIGMINRGTELEFNPTKARHLSNVRSPAKDDYVKVPHYSEASLEMYLTLITESEVLEVTPKALRMRKLILDSRERRLQSRKMKSLQA